MNSSGKNDSGKEFSLTARLESFKHAFSGLKVLLKFEHNSRIHLVVLVTIIFAGLCLRISVNDWMAIIIVSGLVFVSECFNSAVEYVSDVVANEYNEKIKMAKDVAAAGVLISAIIAVIIGVIVFLPEIWKFFMN